MPYHYHYNSGLNTDLPIIEAKRALSAFARNLESSIKKHHFYIARVGIYGSFGRGEAGFRPYNKVVDDSAKMILSMLDEGQLRIPAKYTKHDAALRINIINDFLNASKMHNDAQSLALYLMSIDCATVARVVNTNVYSDIDGGVTVGILDRNSMPSTSIFPTDIPLPLIHDLIDKLAPEIRRLNSAMSKVFGLSPYRTAFSINESPSTEPGIDILNWRSL